LSIGKAHACSNDIPAIIYGGLELNGGETVKGQVQHLIVHTCRHVIAQIMVSGGNKVCSWKLGDVEYSTSVRELISPVKPLETQSIACHVNLYHFELQAHCPVIDFKFKLLG
jgi:hypothetical protein